MVLIKARFWTHWANTPMHKRQIKLRNSLLDGIEGKVTQNQ